VVSGRYRVVLVGDLVHYKDERAYAIAVGADPYDPTDPDHLRRAARAQIRELYRFKDFVEKTGGNLQVILGNHDEAALLHNYDLGTRGGLKHDEFRPTGAAWRCPTTWPTGSAASRARSSTTACTSRTRGRRRACSLRRLLLSRPRHQDLVVREARAGAQAGPPLRRLRAHRHEGGHLRRQGARLRDDRRAGPPPVPRDDPLDDRLDYAVSQV
jgi:hypothetical protein